MKNTKLEEKSLFTEVEMINSTLKNALDGIGKMAIIVKDSRINKRALARILNMAPVTLYIKMNNYKLFTVPELELLMQALVKYKHYGTID